MIGVAEHGVPGRDGRPEAPARQRPACATSPGPSRLRTGGACPDRTRLGEQRQPHQHASGFQNRRSNKASCPNQRAGPANSRNAGSTVSSAAHATEHVGGSSPWIRTSSGTLRTQSATYESLALSDPPAARTRTPAEDASASPHLQQTHRLGAEDDEGRRMEPVLTLRGTDVDAPLSPARVVELGQGFAWPEQGPGSSHRSPVRASMLGCVPPPRPSSSGERARRRAAGPSHRLHAARPSHHRLPIHEVGPAPATVPRCRRPLSSADWPRSFTPTTLTTTTPSVSRSMRSPPARFTFRSLFPRRPVAPPRGGHSRQQLISPAEHPRLVAGPDAGAMHGLT